MSSAGEISITWVTFPRIQLWVESQMRVCVCLHLTRSSSADSINSGLCDAALATLWCSSYRHWWCCLAIYLAGCLLRWSCAAEMMLRSIGKLTWLSHSQSLTDCKPTVTASLCYLWKTLVTVVIHLLNVLDIAEPWSHRDYPLCYHRVDALEISIIIITGLWSYPVCPCVQDACDSADLFTDHLCHCRTVKPPCLSMCTEFAWTRSLTDRLYHCRTVKPAYPCVQDTCDNGHSLTDRLCHCRTVKPAYPCVQDTCDHGHSLTDYLCHCRTVRPPWLPALLLSLCKTLMTVATQSSCLPVATRSYASIGRVSVTGGSAEATSSWKPPSAREPVVISVLIGSSVLCVAVFSHFLNMQLGTAEKLKPLPPRMQSYPRFLLFYSLESLRTHTFTCFTCYQQFCSSDLSLLFHSTLFLSHFSSNVNSGIQMSGTVRETFDFINSLCFTISIGKGGLFVLH